MYVYISYYITRTRLVKFRSTPRVEKKKEDEEEDEDEDEEEEEEEEVLRRFVPPPPNHHHASAAWPRRCRPAVAAHAREFGRATNLLLVLLPSNTVCLLHLLQLENFRID
jgi:2-polyprenyl-6-methoxyphenol hydroxylase-like FAD-dependent oxidoreductase